MRIATEKVFALMIAITVSSVSFQQLIV